MCAALQGLQAWLPKKNRNWVSTVRSLPYGTCVPRQSAAGSFSRRMKNAVRDTAAAAQARKRYDVTGKILRCTGRASRRKHRRGTAKAGFIGSLLGNCDIVHFLSLKDIKLGCFEIHIDCARPLPLISLCEAL